MYDNTVFIYSFTGSSAYGFNVGCPPQAPLEQLAPNCYWSQRGCGTHKTWSLQGVRWGGMHSSGWISMIIVCSYFLSWFCFLIYPAMRKQPHPSATMPFPTKMNSPIKPWAETDPSFFQLLPVTCLVTATIKVRSADRHIGWVHVTDTASGATVRMGAEVSRHHLISFPSGHTQNDKQNAMPGKKHKG